MVYQSRDSVWPFYFISALVLSLMVFSVLSPRMWRRAQNPKIIESSSVSESVPQDIAAQQEQDATSSLHENSKSFESQQVHTVPSDINDTAPIEPAPHITKLYPPRQPAEIAPPVADRYSASTPALEGPLSNDPSADAPQTNDPVLSSPQAEKSQPLATYTPTTDNTSAESQTDLPINTLPTSNNPYSEDTQPVQPSQLTEKGSTQQPTFITSEPVITTGWPHPQQLIDQLRALSLKIDTRPWSLAVEKQADLLTSIDSLADPQSAQVFQALDKLIEESQQLASINKSHELRVELLRARYAIMRRVAVWSDIHKIAANDDFSQPLPEINPKEMVTRLADIEPQIRQLRMVQQWRKYLLLKELAESVQGDSSAVVQRQQLARRILLRIESPAMTEKQQVFFNQGVFQRFKMELRKWAEQPVDLQDLVNALESYETRNNSGDALLVAKAFQKLRCSPHKQIADLGDQVDMHYRNANVRVAIAGTLVNRMLSQQSSIEEEVNEDIQGAQVFGRSTTSTRIFVRFLPDRKRIRVGLEAQGEVASDTEAYKGPAVFYNLGLARYQARKLLTIDRHGVRVWRAEAEADSNNDVTGVATDFDGVPLLGLIVRSIALQQYADQAYLAEYEVEENIASKASTRLDIEVHKRVLAAEKRFKTNVIKPLQDLKLNPVALDLQTTAKRVIVRYRLAGANQLGANTPRPQAPSDSLLSVQIHESSLNNTIGQLKLDGRRVDLRELYHEIAVALGQEDTQVPEDLPKGVTLQFAERDAVGVEFEDGRVSVVLRLAELSTRGGARWKNFEVRGNYQPDGTSLDAQLVRKSYVELSGKRLGLGDQVALRGIFTRVFSQKRPFSIIPDRVAKNPKLQDLRVNQFIVDGGWIGVALGPDRGKLQASGDIKAAHEARQPKSQNLLLDNLIIE